MENSDFGAPLKEALESLRVYIDQQIDYNKLLLGKKMGAIFSYVTLFLLLGFLATLVLIFLSFGIVYWLADSEYISTHFAFLIVAFFYILIAVVIFTWREKIIFGPIRKLLGSILYDDESAENDETIQFSSSELLNHKIKKSKAELEKQEEILKVQLEELGEAYTFTSISQRMLKNAYQSLMTTSNIARFTYLMVQRLKGGKKKKQKKEPPQIGE